MEKIAEETRRYLKNKPYILEALEIGIVNLSELSRIVGRDLGIKNFHAIKAALRRYSIELGSRKEDRSKSILSILGKSRISVTEGVSVMISKGRLEIESIASVSVNNLYLYIINGEPPALPTKTQNSVLRRYSDCSLIGIHSDENIARTYGVVAYLSSLLAQQNINVIEFISTYTETLMVVAKHDALRTYGLLSSLA
jgi:predicted amino acid-binding ACT domain protein